MKSLKEKLEEKIESDCKQYCEEHSNYEFYGWLYKAGAASLVPLVLELVDNLKFISEQSRAAIEQRHMLGDVDNAFDFVVSSLEIKSLEALQSIEKFLEGKNE